MRKFRCLFGGFAFLSFLWMLGAVGAIERDAIDFGAGAVRVFIGLGCFGVFSKLAGAFDVKEKESYPQRSRPKEVEI